MGQRHQLFIIAKILGRYRTIAVVHHQWLYGSGPTKACWRILQILEHPANKQLIRHELCYAAARPNSWWDTLEDTIPFPITAACLLLGSGLDPRPDSYYLYGPEPLSITTTLYEVDNNDGFTIIDISDLDAPRYCFIADPLAPITAVQYHSTYYAKDDPNCPQPADLEAWDLIDADALRELWPEENWEDAGEVATTTREAGKGHDHHIKSLRWLALEKAIISAAEEPEHVEYLTEVEGMPGFHSELWQFLQTHPDLAQRRGGLKLLGFALRRNSGVLDLSSFPWVTPTQVLSLIAENSLAEHITSIDLSNNATVDIGSIQKILHACPRTTELKVICVDSLPLPALLDSLQGFSVRTVLHSDLFQHSIPKDTAIALSRHFHSAAKGRHVVRQAIILGARSGGQEIAWRDVMRQHEFTGLGLALVDARLNPVDVCDWLRPLLHVALDTRVTGIGARSVKQLYAQGLSFATSDLWRIRPLLGSLRYRFSPTRVIREGYGPMRGMRYEEVQQGEWTVLLLLDFHNILVAHGQEYPWPTFNYAFLTRDQEGELVIHDIKDVYRLAIEAEQGKCGEAQLAEFEKQIGDFETYFHDLWLARLRNLRRAKAPAETEGVDILRLGSKKDVTEVMDELQRLSQLDADSEEDY
ncbi:hypothetical protein B0T16DRAFT_407477 [Cercophora newfieldiana]|uniref:Uncharacterized protein n=1 Tax=Cercophora newfieldiana TaxID=92897 RepID=A0AA39YIV0_9PEZI|nr:hypothetical protein B0T16DRAFT_407477 [Cercophora newfieldiana]